MTQYNKLIRDRIVEIIESDGLEYKTRVLEDAEFKQELLKKIVEESNEVLEAGNNREELVKEIGDVLEVIDAIVDAFELDRNTIENVKQERKEKRGGFENRIFLEEMEEKKTD